MPFLHAPCAGKGKPELSALEHEAGVTPAGLLLLSNHTRARKNGEDGHQENHKPEQAA